MYVHKAQGAQYNLHAAHIVYTQSNDTGIKALQNVSTSHTLHLPC